MGYWAIGLFFFQRKTGDRFRIFQLRLLAADLGAAFAPFASSNDESKAYIYLVRLVAFLFILRAIYEKNRSAPASPPGWR